MPLQTRQWIFLLAVAGAARGVVEIRSSDAPGVRCVLEDEPLRPSWMFWNKEERRTQRDARRAADWFADRGYVPAEVYVEEGSMDVRLRPFSGDVVGLRKTRQGTISKRLGLRPGAPFRWQPERWRDVESDFFVGRGSPRAIVRKDQRVALNATGLREREFREIALEVSGPKALQYSVRDNNLLGLGLFGSLSQTPSAGRVACIGEKDRWQVSFPKPCLALGHTNHRLYSLRTMSLRRTVEIRPHDVDLKLSASTNRLYASGRVSLDDQGSPFLGIAMANKFLRSTFALRHHKEPSCAAEFELHTTPNSFLFYETSSRSYGAAIYAGVVCCQFGTKQATGDDVRKFSVTLRLRDPALPEPPTSTK